MGAEECRAYDKLYFKCKKRFIKKTETTIDCPISLMYELETAPSIIPWPERHSFVTGYINRMKGRQVAAEVFKYLMYLNQLT